MRRALQLSPRLDPLQQGQHVGLNALQGGLGVALKSQHQDRRRVGRTDQTKAIGPIDAQPVYGRDLGRR